jgi:protein-S-isoprenylcysteine O-methyltransferase Ste14
MLRVMHKNLFFVLVLICIITHIIRSLYEILKTKKVFKTGKLSLAIIFADMMVLWVSWFILCHLDPHKILLARSIRYLGFSLFSAGMIIFFIALFTIKTLENHTGDLVTNGIYSFFRHPMYLSFIFWLIGYSVFLGVLFSMILAIPLIANILFWRNMEEKELEKRFAGYIEYKKRTLF